MGFCSKAVFQDLETPCLNVRWRRSSISLNDKKKRSLTYAGKGFSVCLPHLDPWVFLLHFSLGVIASKRGRSSAWVGNGAACRDFLGSVIS